MSRVVIDAPLPRVVSAARSCTMAKRTRTRSATRRTRRHGRTAVYAIAAAVAITLAALGVVMLSGDDDSSPTAGADDPA